MEERGSNALEVVVGWLDAMRRGDLKAAAVWFDPQVTWRGVGDGAVCGNREEVLQMLEDAITPCPDDPVRPEDEEGLHGARAVELIAGEAGAVLGAKGPGLGEVGGVLVRGQLFNVFRVRDGRIVEVVDYAFRDEALRAAGATAPSWA
jgi:limonene-1,2-epoxide hydrolase